MFELDKHTQKLFLLTILTILIFLTSVAVLFIYPLSENMSSVISHNPTPTSTVIDPLLNNPPVFLAVRYIDRGEKITPDSVESRICSVCETPFDMISDELEAIGKVARTEIVTGQPIERNMLIDFTEWKRGCSRIDVDAIVCFRPDEGNLYGSDGQNRKWHRDLDSTIFDTLAMANGIIYFWQNDHLYAIDAKTGEEVWSFQDSEIKNVVGSATPVIFDNILVFWSYSNKHLYALDIKSRQVKWKFKATGLIAYPAMIADGVISVVSNDGYLYALDIQSGQELWRAEQ